MVIADDHLESTVTAELFAGARAGDAQAFCLLIEPLQTRLLRQAAALAGNLSDAEDLVSETLVAGWKNFARYDESCRLSTWLYAILLHRYLKSVRRARSRPTSLNWLPLPDARKLHEQQENVPSSEPSPAEAAAQRETFVQLRQCLDRLSERHRRVVMLRFFDGASLPDIATVLGCSLGTVKSRLHHALDKLRQMKMNLPESGGDQLV
jgi:RNA polymerase sigma-70 factor (ECF subfamily)